MDRYIKDFVRFQQVVDPAINTISLPIHKTHEFSLGYGYISSLSKDFVVKFKIVSQKNSAEGIEVVHGYRFSVRNDFTINQNYDKLAGFFACLVLESLKIVNGSLHEGNLEIPPHKSLLNAILPMLTSRHN